uniref:Saposin B-type domain-containing protein n=1 Tax=Parastrongyloides trichosuri TaxID=131310 RepID=A0A0N4Z4Z3_PARTI
MNKFLKIFLFTILVGVAVAFVAPDAKNLLCSPCKFIFNEVKKELPEADKITEEALKVAIDHVCKKYLGAIPLAKDVCEKLTGDALEELYKFILKEDKKIEPESICKHLHMC